MEACPLKKRDINSLDFVVNRLFMKLLKTSDINTVRTCQHMFGFELPSVLLVRRTRKFLEKMKYLWVEVNHFKIDCSLIVMFFTKLIIVVFTLCLLIVFSLFIMLYVFLLLPFLWWNKNVYIYILMLLFYYKLTCILQSYNAALTKANTQLRRNLVIWQLQNAWQCNILYLSCQYKTKLMARLWRFSRQAYNRWRSDDGNHRISDP